MTTELLQGRPRVASAAIAFEVLHGGTPLPPALRRLASPFVMTTFARRDISVFAVVAHADDDPVGLAAGVAAANRQVEILSVFVTPFYRKQGIGRALLASVEDHFTKADAALAVCSISIDPDDRGNGRFLRACGYERPVVTGLRCRATAERALTAPFLYLTPLPPQYRIVAWADLSAAQREELRTGGRFTWNRDTDPFLSEPDCEPQTSIALLREPGAGDGMPVVVGWSHDHVIDERTLRKTNSFVDPALQIIGLVWHLWRESILRQHTLTSRPDFIFAAQIAAPRMARFTERRVRPVLSEIRYSCIFQRRLRNPSGRNGAPGEDVSQAGR